MALTRKQKKHTLKSLSSELTLLRKRVGALEAIALAQVLGAVEIAGELHKLSCAKRDANNAACDCGATPARKTKESRR